MDLTTVTLQVAGKSYQLAGLEDEAHYREIASLADRRIRETAAANPDLNPEACAVAAALSLSDELIKAQSLVSRLRAQLEVMQQETP